MNNAERSAIERVIKHTTRFAEEEAGKDTRRRFPSYLRDFGIFFQTWAAKLHPGTGQPFAVCLMQLPAQTACVAFV
jgi:hypothetical protein